VSKAIDKAAGAERPVVSVETRSDKRGGNYHGSSEPRPPIEWAQTSAASAASAAWSGWGTALKPAWEPVIVARKPLDGIVAANVLKHGTGAINIDGCRIGAAVETWPTSRARPADGFPNALYTHKLEGQPKTKTVETGSAPPGRFPANLIHDGSEEAVRGFPETAGQQAAVRGCEPSTPAKNVYGEYGRHAFPARGDSGSAARFFYCAKAGPEERGGDHPTVKPLALMRYLCRLVTPPGGIVLDPFAGSGSTGVAALQEGFRFLGFEKDAHYCGDICAERLAAASAAVPLAEHCAGQASLFAEAPRP
jgi:site-specific DNA-methyltransferase (adenine-specific)